MDKWLGIVRDKTEVIAVILGDACDVMLSPIKLRHLFYAAPCVTIIA